MERQIELIYRTKDSDKPYKDIFFKNEYPLEIERSNFHYELKSLAFDKFLLIDDFELLLIDPLYEAFGFHIEYYSDNNGVILEFPWWDHAENDIKHFELKNIPFGTIDDPYHDVEEGWQVLIFELNEFIYILNGSSSDCREFYGWYKIKKTEYIIEWNKLINYLKCICM